MEQTAQMRVEEGRCAYGEEHQRPELELALFYWNTERPRVIPVGGMSLLVGSGPATGLRLDDRFVSRRHARLYPEAGQLRVEDLGSTNGTQVNGASIRRASLRPGDTLGFGSARLTLIEAHRQAGARWYSARSWRGAEGSLPTLRRALIAAQVDEPVLITGPTGGGKEVIADLVAQVGARAGRPFVTVNCATLDGPTANAELFGHRAGAFTDAKHERAGLFLEARDGTLLLDEIGDASAEVQAKLLRVLETRSLRRLGDDHQRPIACRVIAATHRDLALEVARGRFREDLLHRLRALQIHAPALRERPDDVEAIARHRSAARGLWLTSGAMRVLRRQPWPGNVRELLQVLNCAEINALFRARRASLDREDIREALGELSPGPSRPSAEAGIYREGGGGDLSLDARVEAAVAQHGSLRRALASLGIPRSSYYYQRARRGAGAGGGEA